MEIINTPIAAISFDETERILHIVVHEGAEMNLENAQIHYGQINKLVGGKKYLALVDASNFYTVEKDAWEYASRKDVVSNRRAVAHYNSSFANKLTTSFFKRTCSTLMPVEIFKTKAEAVEWLRTFVKECV